MNKKERIAAVISGKQVDRVPVAFWRHWPGDDQNPNSLADVTLEFQNKYDLDFIKFPVSSTYCVEDYGIGHAYRGSIMGDREYLSRIIHKPSDWTGVAPLNIHSGVYGWHLDSLRRVIDEKDKDTPIVVTMFNPVAMAAYLAGDQVFLAHIREHPEKAESALEALTETAARFARACIDAGADGIFLSTRFASYEIMNAKEYNRFGRPADLEVLGAASGGWFNVLHLHGQHPMLKELADYPVRALNWHDRTSDIDLKAAAEIFPGVLMGGVEQIDLLQDGTPDEVSAQVRAAINSMNGQRLIVAVGCTYPISVPEVNLRAVRRAIEA